MKFMGKLTRMSGNTFLDTQTPIEKKTNVFSRLAVRTYLGSVTVARSKFGKSGNRLNGCAALFRDWRRRPLFLLKMAFIGGISYGFCKQNTLIDALQISEDGIDLIVAQTNLAENRLLALSRRAGLEGGGSY